ncbi:replication-relaxation family protein (plasmid) [Streptomyces sp. NBC_01220]|uniref:Replication-relaxation family protein n=1 Tax=Streptomyces poriferorum TaxID=2798799 RepID=A0ABY9J2R0_9ACTN|nr:replication-relaxation family protein [Streptomyces sp. Alt2]WLQ61480.1 replication-relaxation family protein [Streptomyces sp. Alt2]WSQ49277.1 replication-relaxation family protein [Streptomyces sp. NBC_01220]
MSTISTAKTAAQGSAGQAAAGETGAHRAVALLAQHRLIAQQQLHQMLSPHAVRTVTSNVLAKLRKDGLVDFTVLPSRQRAWYLTLRGARIATSWPELRGRTVLAPGNSTEASLRAAHTLTVVRAHLAFLADARRLGDDYGPLDWVPEIAHRLPDTGGEDKLIADAVLHYTATSPRRLQYRAFVEVDRATMSSERLARKLISYARFHEYSPQPVGRRGTVADQAAMLAWQRFYPRYPRVLFILTGASARALHSRIEDLRAMTAGHPLVAKLAGQVPLGAAVLEDLEDQAPSAPVWLPLAGPAERCSWMEV